MPRLSRISEPTSSAKSALCIGISVLTGPMIRGAIEAATAVKSHAPIAVVFGGWHPTPAAR